MSPAATIILSLASALILAIVTSFATGLQRKAEKKLDWEREDEVATRAKKAAQLLVESNARVAKVVDDNATQMFAKLHEIKTLVNSDMTAARVEQRDAVKLTLVGIRKIIRLDEDAGREPSQEDLDAIMLADKQIKHLDVLLADRAAQQKAVDLQVEKLKTGT
jgi:hypothetical protein